MRLKASKKSFLYVLPSVLLMCGPQEVSRSSRQREVCCTAASENVSRRAMPGALKVLRGDLFEGPSDLIVIPCTTAGALTKHAERKLLDYRIPRPPGRLELGAVVTRPFEGAENIAQFVAYAATAGAATPAVCIERIAQHIASETITNRVVSRVVAPLIGVGAGERPGQLEAALQAIRRGFLATCTAHAVLTLHIADDRLFDSAAGWFSREARDDKGSSHVKGATGASKSMAPRVFVSYTKTSDEHAHWVERLATMLRANGVDARFDRWHLRPGMDVAQFMCNEIAMADRVVIISNEEYAKRADGRLGGVGWETRLISGDLLTGSAGDRTRDLRSGVPMFLRSTLVIQWPDDTTDAHCGELLLRALHDKTAAEPPLLPPPLFG
jgi:hypothetical protein